MMDTLEEDQAGNQQKIEVLKRAIPTIAEMREDLDLGENTETFKEVLFHMGGILEHAEVQVNQIGAETFVHLNNDGSVDRIFVHRLESGPPLIEWTKIYPVDNGRWEGYEMNISAKPDSTKIEASAGEGVLVDGGRVDARNFAFGGPTAEDEWVFKKDGSIDHKQYQDDPFSKTSLDQTPIAEHFLPPKIEVQE